MHFNFWDIYINTRSDNELILQLALLNFTPATSFENDETKMSLQARSLRHI